MSLWDTITGFIDKNKVWIKPVAKAVTGFAANRSNDDTRKSYENFLKQKEDRNYADSKAAWEYKQDQDLQAAANANARSRAKAATANANAKASRDAAIKTEKNRQKAAKKANKIEQASFAKALEMYAPYVKSGLDVLPGKVATYNSSLDSMKTLKDYLSQPERTQVTPASETLVTLPDYLLKR